MLIAGLPCVHLRVSFRKVLYLQLSVFVISEMHYLVNESFSDWVTDWLTDWLHETGLSGNVVASFFPLIIFIYIYIIIYIYIYMYIYVYIYIYVCMYLSHKLRTYAFYFSTTARRVISSTWGPPPPCKQALIQGFTALRKAVTTHVKT